MRTSLRHDDVLNSQPLIFHLASHDVIDVIGLMNVIAHDSPLSLLTVSVPHCLALSACLGQNSTIVGGANNVSQIVMCPSIRHVHLSVKCPSVCHMPLTLSHAPHSVTCPLLKVQVYDVNHDINLSAEFRAQACGAAWTRICGP